MKRLIIIALTLIVIAAAAYVLDQYWIHRYDSLIATEAARYHVDPDLVWSIAYEESYFASWKNGKAGEIGVMQVTPGVLQDWASENAGTAIQQRSATDATQCCATRNAIFRSLAGTYRKAADDFRDLPDREARMLAAYNAGRRRAAEWNRVPDGAPPLTEQQFIDRIDIASTRAYVSSILKRYRHVKEAKAR
jgi:soluble lytic murein transglycosylase-like protein